MTGLVEVIVGVGVPVIAAAAGGVFLYVRNEAKAQGRIEAKIEAHAEAAVKSDKRATRHWEANVESFKAVFDGQAETNEKVDGVRTELGLTNERLAGLEGAFDQHILNGPKARTG